MTPPGSRRHSCRVLLIEDDADSAEALGALLEWEGYLPVRAASAQHGLALLSSREGAADAVLLDLTLPDLSVGELLRRVAEVRGRPPVIVTSALPEPALRDAVRRLGAAGYLRKPFETARLLDMLERVLPPAGPP